MVVLLKHGCEEILEVNARAAANLKLQLGLELAEAQCLLVCFERVLEGVNRNILVFCVAQDDTNLIG